jgi:hypothetical protein
MWRLTSFSFALLLSAPIVLALSLERLPRHAVVSCPSPGASNRRGRRPRWLAAGALARLGEGSRWRGALQGVRRWAGRPRPGAGASGRTGGGTGWADAGGGKVSLQSGWKRLA